ncbi:hypothetical protein KAI12_00955 [Candidatus Bathyarchaeota archaeon]|nr:hypothetical protein [Candidatus Bathyarchaeota archaeon]
MGSAKFHLKEIDWVIYFPFIGNKDRDYLEYSVAYRDRKRKRTQPGRRIDLKEVLDKPEIRNNYPHTIGCYLNSTGRGKDWTPEYLITRKVLDRKELIRFATKLGI